MGNPKPDRYNLSDPIEMQRFPCGHSIIIIEPELNNSQVWC